MMDANFENKVRERAYQIWVAAGCEDGLADLHWRSAEQEVMGEISIPNAKVVKLAKPRAAKAEVKVAAAPAPKKPAAPRRKAKGA